MANMVKCKKCGREYNDIDGAEIIMCEECSDYCHWGERRIRIVKPYDKICGKRRRLTPGAPPMFFLFDRKDVEELGIWWGLTPTEWIRDRDGHVKNCKFKMMVDNEWGIEVLKLFDEDMIRSRSVLGWR